MGYSDQKFYARPWAFWQQAVNGTATATASDHVVTNTDQAELPEFNQRTQVNAIKVHIVTAPNAGATGTIVAFLNGTSTFGSATIGTNTAGVVVDATMTAANAIFAAGEQPQVSLISTATASENTDQGTYEIRAEQQELFAA